MAEVTIRCPIVKYANVTRSAYEEWRWSGSERLDVPPYGYVNNYSVFRFGENGLAEANIDISNIPFGATITNITYSLKVRNVTGDLHVRFNSGQRYITYSKNAMLSYLNSLSSYASIELRFEVEIPEYRLVDGIVSDYIEDYSYEGIKTVDFEIYDIAFVITYEEPDDSTVSYGTKNGWSKCKVFYGTATGWKPVKAHYGTKDGWKPVK